TAVGPQPVVCRLTLGAPTVSLESLLENGVGQGPALSLRLVVPPAATPPTPDRDVPDASGDVAAPTARPTTEPVTDRIPAVSQFLGFGNDLIGRPPTEVVPAADGRRGFAGGSVVPASGSVLLSLGRHVPTGVNQGSGSTAGPGGNGPSDGTVSPEDPHSLP